eukprot:900507_1
MTGTSMYSMTTTNDDPLRYEVPIDSPLVGNCIKLKNVDNDEIMIYQIQSITSPTKQRDESQDKDLPDLIKDSTNSWLYIDNFDCHDTDQCTKLFISIVVIILQLLSYATLTYFFVNSNQEEIADRESNCYGPNCETPPNRCMYISTGCVTAMLLIGFLWADIINTFALLKDSIDCQVDDRGKKRLQFIASMLILVELIMALICGIYVGVYSTTEWDSINGAVGILFVHDLDEAIYSAMELIESNWKKVLALILWIILSVVVAVSCTCRYPNDWVVFRNGDCKEGEFECGDGECIWYGFVCNGVEECLDGLDETVHCNFSLINCPIDTFRCDSDGSCIDMDKRCNGELDCPNGEDESRTQNCSAVLAQKQCSDIQPNYGYKYTDSVYYWLVADNGAMFKCDNGQCIEWKYMCDGVIDCLDGSDEYPNFYRLHEWPFFKQCPYDRLIECASDEILCKKSGHCIPKTRVCDGVNDCPNGEDERLCDYRLCGILDIDWMKQFRCNGNIAAFNVTSIITFNGTVFDYTNVNFSMYNVYPNGTKIEDAECIPWEWRCDGMHDCVDGSDELLCELNIFQCKEDEFKCANGDCIPMDWQCDYYDDCDSGSDESDCNLFYNTEANAQYLSCNEEPIRNTIQLGSDYSYYYKIHIPCDEYKAVQFTTCNEYTVDLNTKMWVRRGEGEFNANTGWENEDTYQAGISCRENVFSSTVIINEDEFVCDVTYTILIQPETPKQTFGDFGINVICSDTNFIRHNN